MKTRLMLPAAGLVLVAMLAYACSTRGRAPEAAAETVTPMTR